MLKASKRKQDWWKNHIVNGNWLTTLSVIFFSYHFIRTIFTVPFCPIPICPLPFCPYTILSIPFLIDDFVHNILFVPFCPYHFVHTILPNTILSVHHFVRYHFVLEPVWSLQLCLSWPTHWADWSPWSSLSFSLRVTLNNAPVSDYMRDTLLWLPIQQHIC